MTVLYDIRLTIHYRYDSPAGFSRSLLRIAPANTGEQALISGRVSADPPADQRREGRDFFGNAVVELAHDRPLADVDFRFSGRVRRDAPRDLLDLSGPLSALPAEIAAQRSLAPAAPHHFTGPSERIAPVPEITAFARDHLRAGMSVMEAVHALSSALHGRMEFDPDATHVGTAPAEAFGAARGVCQDFSHVLIAALRAVGVPAGYVSGFLRTDPPEGQPRLEGADAMHAWVRAWCGADLGWVEIDPTNDIWVGNDHVSVAVGRDYADVAPVRGALRAAGGHSTLHKVDVIPVE